MPRTRNGLTYRERSVFEYIRKYTAEHGYSPTMREIAKATGYKSTSLVTYYLTNLEREGLIKRDFSTARSIVITGSL